MRSLSVLEAALVASEATVATVALRRVSPDVDGSVYDLLQGLGITLLPNTAGCYTAADAVMTARLQPAMRTTPVCQPVPSGPVTVDCGDVSPATTSSFTITASPDNLVMHAGNLAPPRTAGGFAGCNTQIACNAEI